MGSKSRIAKYIVPIIQKYIDNNNVKIYIEPFVGGANVIDKISCKKKIGGDKQQYLIALYQNLNRISELPKFVTKEHYSDVRLSFNNNTDKYEDWYKGGVGFLASYNGRFFDGGYAGIVHTKSGIDRNYYDEAKRNLEAQIIDLQNVEWRCGDYKNICGDIKSSVIYCDPPYQGTKQYGISKNFDYDIFWSWCREMSKNNIVIISEHSAPDDFRCIWEQDVKRTIDNTKRITVTEKLFIHK